MTAYSPRLDRALATAARAHRAQLRKGTDVPYVQHPVHVAIILLKHGFPEEVAIAGLLHDVVEDCGVSASEIRADFGDAVADLVASVSETKTDGAGARPWRVRKGEQLAHLAEASPHAAALKAADALHNCHATVRELEAARARGEAPSAVWRRFNAPPSDQVWYYREIARGVRDRLGDHALADELSATVEHLARLA